MKYNPTKVSFTHPTKYTDGTPFGASDYAGMEFAYRVVGSTAWIPTVAIPVSFTKTEVPISDLDLPRNKALELAGRTVAANGTISEWSIPSNPFIFDVRVAEAPVLYVA